MMHVPIKDLSFPSRSSVRQLAFEQLSLELGYRNYEPKEFISIEKLALFMQQCGINFALDKCEVLAHQINHAVQKQIIEPVKIIRGARAEILLFWDTWGITKSNAGEIKAWERDTRYYVGSLNNDDEMEYFLRLAINGISTVSIFRVWIKNILQSYGEFYSESELKIINFNRELITKLADSLADFYDEAKAIKSIFIKQFEGLPNAYSIASIAIELANHGKFNMRILKSAVDVKFSCASDEYTMLMLYGQIWGRFSKYIDFSQISSGKALLNKYGVSQNERHRLRRLTSDEMYHLTARFPLKSYMARLYLNEINIALKIKDQLHQSSHMFISAEIADTILLTAYLRLLENNGHCRIYNTKLRLIFKQLHNVQDMIQIAGSWMKNGTDLWINNDNDVEMTNARSTSIGSVIQLIELYRKELFTLQVLHVESSTSKFDHHMIDSDNLGWIEDIEKVFIDSANKQPLKSVLDSPQFDQVSDWFLATNPVLDKQRMKLGWKYLEKLAVNWHSIYTHDHSWVLDYPDWSCITESHTLEWRASVQDNAPFEIIPLNTPVLLLEESNAMQHCVATYVEDCVRGDVRIFSIRIPQSRMRIATAELRKSDNIWSLVQLKGKYNQDMIQRINDQNDPLFFLMHTLVEFYNQHS